jgi:hypothetical protein
MGSTWKQVLFYLEVEEKMVQIKKTDFIVETNFVENKENIERLLVALKRLIISREGK